MLQVEDFSELPERLFLTTKKHSDELKDKFFTIMLLDGWLVEFESGGGIDWH